MNSFKKDQDFRLAILGDYDEYQTPELTTYTIVETSNVKSNGDSNVSLKEEEVYNFGLSIHIEGDFVLLDYKPMFTLNKYCLSELLGFEGGYLAKGNLTQESFRTIQLRLQGVLALYASDYVRMAA